MTFFYLFVICVYSKKKITQINFAEKDDVSKNRYFRDACGVKIRGCEESTFPEARKKEGNEKRREILFLLEVWRYGRMVRWKRDEKKEKSPVDVRVDGLKRYELEARRSSHSLRLPG